MEGGACLAQPTPSPLQVKVVGYNEVREKVETKENAPYNYYLIKFLKRGLGESIVPSLLTTFQRNQRIVEEKNHPNPIIETKPLFSCRQFSALT